MQTVLEAKGLKKYYGKEPNVTKALDGVSMEVKQGEFVSIIGTSGSGKSTLLNMLGGLDVPTEGSVAVRGKALQAMNEEQATVFRRRNIGFIFQNYNLVPMLNVYQNMILPVKLDAKHVDRDYMQEIIHLLHLDQKLFHLPNNLSGGQQQRVAIARALVGKPAVILADEPTGNLDSKTSEEVLEVLKDSCRQFHQTLVMITHNPEIAHMAQRVIRIEDGRIAKEESR